jgi:outer membrane protein OmpA-like peptidoglycan-associated protein
MNARKNKILIFSLAVFLCHALPRFPVGHFVFAAKPDELLSDSLTKVGPVKRGGKITVPGFYFSDGSYAVGDNLKKYLKNAAASIKKTGYSKIFVDGYTDDLGERAANNRLSRSRAEAVRKELVKNGISPAKIKVRAYGSSNPVVPNNSKNGRIQNRRIEIKII